MGNKSLLLLQEVVSGRLGSLFLQGQVHALVTTVPVGLAGFDAV
jgi:hypothetical protein